MKTSIILLIKVVGESRYPPKFVYLAQHLICFIVISELKKVAK